MNRNGQNVGVFPEYMLGAVAVMNVPVDDRNPAKAVALLGVAGRQRSIVEHAEAKAVVSLRVMARRPDEPVGVANAARHDRVDRFKHSPYGKGGDVIAAGPEWRFAADELERGVSTVACAETLQRLNVGGGVHASELGVRRRPRFDEAELFGEAGHV